MPVSAEEGNVITHTGNHIWNDVTREEEHHAGWRKAKWRQSERYWLHRIQCEYFMSTARLGRVVDQDEDMQKRRWWWQEWGNNCQTLWSWRLQGSIWGILWRLLLLESVSFERMYFASIYGKSHPPDEEYMFWILVSQVFPGELRHKIDTLQPYFFFSSKVGNKKSAGKLLQYTSHTFPPFTRVTHLPLFLVASKSRRESRYHMRYVNRSITFCSNLFSALKTRSLLSPSWLSHGNETSYDINTLDWFALQNSLCWRSRYYHQVSRNINRVMHLNSCPNFEWMSMKKDITLFDDNLISQKKVQALSFLRKFVLLQLKQLFSHQFL